MSVVFVETDVLPWLQGWHTAHCNGDWEHRYGVHLETLDNPGWSLQVDLQETEREDRPFPTTELERTEGDWMRCRVADGRFEGYGGAGNLLEILAVFRHRAEQGRGK